MANPWNDPEAQPFIRIQGVSKSFGDYVAVNKIDLDIYQGELFSLLGGSGCGKTTLLRMLAGFETPTEGKIFIDGVDMSSIPPYERPVNMMFQSYALFPHMSVEQNVAFGLKQDGVPKKEIAERVAAILDMVQMGKFASRKPHQLSGGQRQRVALARALVKEPKVLLLDEPLGALDKKLREKTQFELVNIQERIGITFIVVTHDQEEAMTMSTRMAVMNQGMIEQVGSPVEVYEYPATRFVGEFIGSANMFEGTVVEEATDHAVVRCPELDADIFINHATNLPPGAPVVAMVRPEKMKAQVEKPESQYNYVRGVVTEIAYLGDMSIYHVRLATGMVVQISQTNLRHTAEQRLTWDDEVYLTWHPGNCVVLAQ
ncbi:ABC transporter ATP-binding protein [Telmatospirillum sp. J64-1]|uniref:ABC transporter ATP-binding protein n=1 Tax=Telmatospirillum sp. J64-1 TaxID=2502183 RepID=UPI002107A5C3|nr:ABC transporter ATP-binding protein [Telmatospirillum sp. J64-1]